MSLTFAQVVALPDQLKGPLDLLRGLLDKDSLPTTVAALALLISVWSVAVSRRGLKISERSATASELQARHAAEQSEAAANQASAAFDQANSAGIEANASSEANELSALESARARMDARMPRILTQIFKKADLAGLKDMVDLTEAPISTDLDGSRKKELSHWSTDGSAEKIPHWAWDAYFVSYGFIQNFGDEPVRVVTADVQFYEGKHPITGEDVPDLSLMQDGIRILYPESSALFQVVARKQVDDWVQILRENPGARGTCEGYIWFYPADLNEAECGVKIITSGMPLEFGVPAETYAIFKPRSWFDVNLEYIRKYPDSVEEVLAHLKDDKEALFLLQLSKTRTKQLSDDRRGNASGQQ
jgi:hypothetical protein